MRKYKIVILLVMGMVQFGLCAQDRYIADSVKKEALPDSKKSSHRLFLGYGINCSSETYKVFNRIPPLDFSLDYTYDIPWKHKRVNFFAVGGVGFSTCRRNGKLYLSGSYRNTAYEKYDAYSCRIYLGLGIKVKLAYFLNVSVFYAGGYGYRKVETEYSDGMYTTNIMFIPSHERHQYRGVLSARLTGEVKKVQIFAGYECLFPGHLLSVGLGYCF